MNINTIRYDEKLIFDLRGIYNRFGYSRYMMSKFEEYELYARNKDFLISDNVITFTDTNGKLMALKPDVTLSIVKNRRDIPGFVQRLYYDENVYRVSKGSRSFKELMQMGLECIGDIDDYCVFEVLQLAAESLKCISRNSILNISSLDVISELLDGISDADRKHIFTCIGEKNMHELRLACSTAEMDAGRAEQLERLVGCHGAPSEIMDEIACFLGDSPAFKRLSGLIRAFDGSDVEDLLRIDFSVMGDENYYNGIVFKGYIDGVPSAVLSGGQYDRLMRKMKRKAGAIGFAVYLDLLERIYSEDPDFDADVLLIYKDGDDLQAIRKAVASMNAEGKSVIAQKARTDHLHCKMIARLNNGEVEIIEDHA